MNLYSINVYALKKNPRFPKIHVHQIPRNPLCSHRDYFPLNPGVLVMMRFYFLFTCKSLCGIEGRRSSRKTRKLEFLVPNQVLLFGSTSRRIS